MSYVGRKPTSLYRIFETANLLHVLDEALTQTEMQVWTL